MTAGDARRRVRRGLTAAVLVLGAGSQLGWSCTETCEQPYRPIASRWRPSGGEGAGVWVGEWPVTGDRRDYTVPELDTDGDGITDWDETYAVFGYYTNPDAADTDDDGIDDDVEIFASNGYATNPTNPDSDNGGVDDGQEVSDGTNPLDGADDLAPTGMRIDS